MATALASFTSEVAAMPITLVASASTTKLPTTLKQVGQRRDYQMINPRLIDVEEDFNPRNFDLPENKASLEELKASIAEQGLIQPLIVRFNRETGRASLVDGERRLRCIWALIAEGHPVISEADVPCFPAPSGSNDKASRLLTAITANTGKPLSKLELGVAFQKLYNMGLSYEKITARTGYSNAFITQAMELADAPEEVKQLLSAQAVSPSLALAELRANGAAAVETLKAAANAAQSNGQKTAKRAKAKTLPPAKPQTENDPAPIAVQAKSKPAFNHSALLKAFTDGIFELLSDVVVSELDDPKIERVLVDKTLLLKLASLTTCTLSDEGAESLKAKINTQSAAF